VLPSAEELKENPRSRSAKLRVAERVAEDEPSAEENFERSHRT